MSVAAAEAKLMQEAVARGSRRHRRREVAVLSTRIGVIVGFLVIWELVSGRRGEDGTYLIDSFYVSKPSEIWAAILEWHDSGSLWPNVWITAVTTLVGFSIGCVAGLFTGFIFGVNEFTARVFSPIVSALYAIPRLALIPLFLLWFGLGIESKIALVIVIVFFMVFYNTYSGVRDVDKELVNVLRVMDASAWQLHSKVTLPSAMNWIIAGLRLSAPYALVGAVTGEMIASNRGMGYLIIRSSGQFFTPGVFAGIVVLMLMAMIMTAGVGLVERRWLRWKPSVSEQL